MGNTVRKPKLSLEEDLLSRPKSYSFEMTAKILCHHAHQEYGKEISVYDAPMRTVSINTFYLRSTEIEKITKEEGKQTVYIERLNIAGLNAPLPTPYAEMINERIMKKDFSFRMFINSFNARILGIAYQVSKKRFLCLQANKNKDYMVIRSLAKFFGETNIDRKFSRLSYLFWVKEKSAVGLESIIKYLYPVDVHVEQLVPVRELNPNNNRLGHMRLGVNSDLGTHFTVMNFCVSIHISGENSIVYKLISDKEKKEELNRIIRKYLGDFIKFKVYVTPKNVKPLEMGKVLGYNSWISGKCLQESQIL